MLRLVFCVIISLALSSGYAQLMTPQAFFPHDYTKSFTPHHLIVDYYQHVAANSDKVQLIEYGRTNEHRPLLMAIVSTPENLSNLESIRLNNRRIAGLETGDPDLQNAKTIVWLSYSVHGNESAGTEAAPGVLFALAGGLGDSGEWLQNTIVILDPCINPDGFNRYSNWNSQVSSKSFDANAVAREHDEPWPGGRMNHYYFDLNRDWAWQTQIESQHRVVQYRHWMPHVHVDLHEMGANSPYYFAPAAQPYHSFITDWQREFQDIVGRNNAMHFDRQGWRYFTKEVFDLFYPSYGDTYPMCNGAIGMTYEQGGSGFAGRGIKLRNGDTLFLADRIEHHITTSLSTIEVSSRHRDDLVSSFQKFFDRSQANPPGRFKTFVIKGTNAQGKLQALCALLDKQGIQYGMAESTMRSTNSFSYRQGGDGMCSIEKQDLVISAYQPRAVLVQTLFEPHGELVDSLTYDITAWSLPYAYGLEAYALESKVNITPGYPFEKIAPLESSAIAYAYVVEWESMREATFVAQTLKHGLVPRYASEAFVVGTRKYPAGTILYMRADHRNKPNFNTLLIDLSHKSGTPLAAINSGFVDQGSDLGSSSYPMISQPNVLTIAGDRVSSYSCGQIWHTFEQVLDYPLTIVNLESLGSVDWTDFNVLILPEGFYSIDEGTMTEIKKWVRGGGKVIAIGSAVRNFADKEGFALKAFSDGGREEELKKAREQEALDNRLEPYADGERRRLSGRVPGAIFEAQVDRTHPLGFGLGDKYFTLKTGSSAYEHLTDATNAVYLNDNPVNYGFAGFKAREALRNTIVFAEEQSGRGSIIYMVDNPLFRAFWENGKFAFCNALFIAGN